jgi:hypothetical protein
MDELEYLQRQLQGLVVQYNRALARTNNDAFKYLDAATNALIEADVQLTKALKLTEIKNEHNVR